MDDMGEIMESDKTLERQYVAAREETEAVKAEYEEVREDYEEKHSQLKAEQAQLEKQIEDAYAALASLEEEIEEAIAEYKAAEAEEQAAAAAIRNIIAQINEQHRQEAANNGGADAGGSSSGGGDSGSGGGGGASGTGSFVWPVPCSTRVTSRFGPRVDPITGAAGTQHDGIDIDGFGNAGNAIVAADSGTVARAESHGRLRQLRYHRPRQLHPDPVCPYVRLCRERGGLGRAGPDHRLSGGHGPRHRRALPF